MIETEAQTEIVCCNAAQVRTSKKRWSNDEDAKRLQTAARTSFCQRSFLAGMIHFGRSDNEHTRNSLLLQSYADAHTFVDELMAIMILSRSKNELTAKIRDISLFCYKVRAET